MKLATILLNGNEQLAMLVQDQLYPIDQLHSELVSTMGLFLQYWESQYPIALQLEQQLKNGMKTAHGISVDQAIWLAPVPFPTSCRDGYAFRQHVESARRNRGVDMIAAFDEYPIFYFTNHNAIQGPGPIPCMPDHFQQLDFELEVAVVICKTGRNIKAEDADQFIAGLMVMNDMSARTLQMEEMLLNLGPAKGKDFSTVIGPWLVTLDELRPYEVAPPAGHVGKAWRLPMRCSVNGVQVSEGNLADMTWTFAEIIERCAYGVTLHPGDVIGSGTVGTGCFLELNGTGKRLDPNYVPQWLQPGDVVECEIEGLGILKNTIVKEDSDFSILARKK